MATLSGLESHLGYWLRFVSNQVSHRFAVKLGACDVTVAEWVIMRELFESDAVPPSALAERLGMTRGAISKLIDRLLAKGLVTRSSEQDDRRYQRIALAPAGRALVPELAALADRNDEEFFGHLAPVDRRQIEMTMRDIVHRLGLRGVPIE